MPFYGESSFTMYNKRILDEAGLTMPDAPTWEEVAEIARSEPLAKAGIELSKAIELGSHLQDVILGTGDADDSPDGDSVGIEQQSRGE